MFLDGDKIWILLSISKSNIYMLFAGWEVHMVKNCDRGLENAAEVTVFHHTDRPLAGK